MKKKFFLLIALCFLPAVGQAGWKTDVETGLAYSGYNVVRIPGAGGTYISLNSDLSVEPVVYYRLKAIYELNDRDEIALLAAPLSLTASGRLPGDVVFAGETFSSGSQVDATFRFDSYRVSYLRTIRNESPWVIKIGFTAKIRDASIKLDNRVISSEKKNTGFVPLIGFSAEYTALNGIGFIVAGDALAAPQGRAEDILLALTYKPDPKLCWRLGYRFVEGGADNKEVFNFALVNYLAAGLTYSW
jgi:hypothetical protein